MLQTTLPTHHNLTATINPLLVNGNPDRFRTTKSGWRIKGKRHRQGLMPWVGNFEAVSELGRVTGNLNGTLSYDNQAALDDFLRRHQPINFKLCERDLYKVSRRVFSRLMEIIDTNPIRFKIAGMSVVQYLDSRKRVMAEIITRGKTQEHFLRHGEWTMHDVIGVGCHLARNSREAMSRLNCKPGKYVVQNLANHKIEIIES